MSYNCFCLSLFCLILLEPHLFSFGYYFHGVSFCILSFFSLCMSLDCKWISCRQHIVGPIFLNPFFYYMGNLIHLYFTLLLTGKNFLLPIFFKVFSSFKCLDLLRVLALLLSVLDVLYSSAHKLLPVGTCGSADPLQSSCLAVPTPAFSSSNLIVRLCHHSIRWDKTVPKAPSCKSEHQTKFCSCSFHPKGGGGEGEVKGWTWMQCHFLVFECGSCLVAVAYLASGALTMPQ